MTIWRRIFNGRLSAAVFVAAVCCVSSCDAKPMSPGSEGGDASTAQKMDGHSGSGSTGNSQAQASHASKSMPGLGWTLPVSDASMFDAEGFDSIKSNLSSISKTELIHQLKTFLIKKPNNTDTRFFLAKQLLAEGHLDQASQEFETLLQADLPKYYSQVLTETSQVKLTFSPQELKKQWDAALQEGWPLLYFEPAKTVETGEPQEYFEKYFIRPGIYHIDSHQFLPVGFGERGMIGVVFNGRKNEVVSVYGNASVDLFSTFYGISLKTEPWVPNNTPVNHSVLVGDPQEGALGADLSIINGQLHYTALEKTEQVLAAPASSHGNEVLRVLGEGSVLIVKTQGYRLSEGRLILPSENTIKLPDDHREVTFQSVVKVESGIFVVSSQHVCGPSPGAEFTALQHHAIDYIDASSLKVTRISSGDEVASVAKKDPNQVWMQVGDTLTVLTRVNKQWQRQTLPRQLVLHVPMREKHCVYH